MNRNDEYRRHDWQRGGEGRGVGGGGAPAFDSLRGFLLQAGLWASGCLVIATSAPAVLVAPLLRELLLIAAFLVSMIGLLRGEALTLKAFNRQDVALLLVALGLIAGFFIDHTAVQAYIDAQSAGAAG